MKNRSGYIWILFALLAVLVVDAYYQVQSSPVPIWQTEWFLWRACAVILLILGALFYYYTEAKRSTKKELEEFKEKVIAQQEAEWKVIAGELHDSIGQNLSAVNIFLQQEINSGSSGSRLEEASQIIVDTVDEVRRISQRLYPKQIERLGLKVSIEAMTDRIAAASGISFNRNIENIDNALERGNEVQYFRIVQELLNNIMKHAGAKNVTINVKRSVMFIVTEITDDGIGFEGIDPVKTGFGLINIEERMRVIKAVYEFRSEKGKGTWFKFTVPIK